MDPFFRRLSVPAGQDGKDPLEGIFFERLQEAVRDTAWECREPVDSLDTLADDTSHPEAMLPLIWGIRYGLEQSSGRLLTR